MVCLDGLRRPSHGAVLRRRERPKRLPARVRVPEARSGPQAHAEPVQVRASVAPLVLRRQATAGGRLRRAVHRPRLDQRLVTRAEHAERPEHDGSRVAGVLPYRLDARPREPRAVRMMRDCLTRAPHRLGRHRLRVTGGLVDHDDAQRPVERTTPVIAPSRPAGWVVEKVQLAATIAADARTRHAATASGNDEEAATAAGGSGSSELDSRPGGPCAATRTVRRDRERARGRGRHRTVTGTVRPRRRRPIRFPRSLIRCRAGSTAPTS